MRINILLILFFILCNDCFAERQLVQKLETVDKERITFLQCLDSNNCYAISKIDKLSGDEDFIHSYMNVYKSTDQGDTWDLDWNTYYIPGKDSVWTFMKGCILDSNHFYFTFLERMIVDMTTDGGETFKRITFGEFSQDNLYSIDEIAMYDKNTGIILFNRGILTTKDGWDTYEHYPFENAAESSSDLEFLDSNNVLIQSGWHNNSFDIFNIPNQTRTSYSDPIESPPGEEKKRLYNVFQVTDSLFYACGAQYYGANSAGKDIIYRSTDRGRNWEIIYENIKEHTFSCEVLTFRNESHGIAAGGWGKFMETFDGGYTWNYYDDLPHGVENSAVQRTAFAGKYPLLSTSGGGIYRVEEVNSVAESPESGISIMPNPASDYIEITINKPSCPDFIGAEGSEIAIYDVLGLRIITVETRHALSLHKIDISHLPRGIYFVRIGNKVEKFVKN